MSDLYFIKPGDPLPEGQVWYVLERVPDLVPHVTAICNSERDAILVCDALNVYAARMVSLAGGDMAENVRYFWMGGRSG